MNVSQVSCKKEPPSAQSVIALLVSKANGDCAPGHCPRSVMVFGG